MVNEHLVNKIVEAVGGVEIALQNTNEELSKLRSEVSDLNETVENIDRRQHEQE